MNTPVTDDRLEDDRFEGELRRLLQSATSTLEPHLTLDDARVVSQFGDQSGRRTWARAGAWV